MWFFFLEEIQQAAVDSIISWPQQYRLAKIMIFYHLSENQNAITALLPFLYSCEFWICFGFDLSAHFYCIPYTGSSQIFKSI